MRCALVAGLPSPSRQFAHMLTYFQVPAIVSYTCVKRRCWLSAYWALILLTCIKSGILTVLPDARRSVIKKRYQISRILFPILWRSRKGLPLGSQWAWRQFRTAYVMTALLCACPLVIKQTLYHIWPLAPFPNDLRLHIDSYQIWRGPDLFHSILASQCPLIDHHFTEPIVKNVLQ